MRIFQGLFFCVLGLILATPLRYPELMACGEVFPPAIPGLYNAIVVVASIVLMVKGSTLFFSRKQ